MAKLAKKEIIRNLISQRKFIEEQLELRNRFSCGIYRPFRYKGYIFPENVDYFKEEGYNICTLDSIDALVKTNGLPINIFFPDVGIVLSEEDMKQSEQYANPSSNDDTTDTSPVNRTTIDDYFSVLSEKVQPAWESFTKGLSLEDSSNIDRFKKFLDSFKDSNGNFDTQKFTQKADEFRQKTDDIWNSIVKEFFSKNPSLTKELEDLWNSSTSSSSDSAEKFYSFNDYPDFFDSDGFSSNR